MQRTTITLDDDLAALLEAHLLRTGSQSRSEAVRDLIRRGLLQTQGVPQSAACFGVVSCVVDHSIRNLAARLPQGRLDRHDQTVASLSVPIDHSHGIEVAVMRGPAGGIADYAEALFLERGVMHGTLGLIPVAEDGPWHVHGTDSAHRPGAGPLVAYLQGTAMPASPVAGQMPSSVQAHRPMPDHGHAHTHGPGGHTHLRVLASFSDMKGEPDDGSDDTAGGSGAVTDRGAGHGSDHETGGGSDQESGQ